MIEYILYIIKSTVYLSVFYVFFMLVMRKTTFFRFNRIVFLVLTALCLVLPLLHISLPQIPVMPVKTIEEVLAPAVVSNGELYEMQEQNVLLQVLQSLSLVEKCSQTLMKSVLTHVEKFITGWLVN